MILKESFSIDAGDPVLIHIGHVQLLDTGVDLGGRLWFERRNLGWAVAALNANLRIYGFPESVLARGDDALKVFESGPEQAPVINLFNRRETSARHGGIYALMFSREVARQLVAELTALRDAAPKG